MKKTIKALIVLSGSILLAGCVEDGVYSSDEHYYSSNRSYPTDATSGYNRNYQKRNKSYQNTPKYPAQGNGGYGSSGNAPSRPAAPPPPPALSDGGYSSSPGGNQPEAPHRPTAPAPSPSDGGYSSNPGNSAPGAMPISSIEPVNKPIEVAPAPSAPVEIQPVQPSNPAAEIEPIKSPSPAPVEMLPVAETVPMTEPTPSIPPATGGDANGGYGSSN